MTNAPIARLVLLNTTMLCREDVIPFAMPAHKVGPPTIKPNWVNAFPACRANTVFTPVKQCVICVVQVNPPMIKPENFNARCVTRVNLLL